MRLASAALLVACAIGCEERTYLGEEGLFAFAITADTPPLLQSEDAVLYRVEERISIPLRAPSDARLAELPEEPPAPFARAPYVERHDYELEVDWVLSNLDDESRRVTLMLNGFNEFHEYVPGVVVEDDELIEDFAQWERSFALEPRERRVGTIREEEIDEIAVDLATVVNGAPNSNQVVHPQSRSATDPRSQLYIPDVIPALTGLRAGLQTTSEANVVLELSVRVRDVRGIVVRSSNAWELPAPEVFAPVAPVTE